MHTQVSDRRGRKLVLGICAIGALLTDANFITSSYYIRSIPGGYWSLLVGPLLDGLLGGTSYEGLFLDNSHLWCRRVDQCTGRHLRIHN